MSNSGYYQAAASAAGSLLGAGPSYGFNAMGASLAFDRQKKMIIRGPTWAVKGLKRAGLNPILAASGGLKIGGAGDAKQAHAAQNSNAGLAGAQGLLLGEQSSAANAAAAHSNAQADIVRAGQPRADALRAFYQTERGRALLITAEENAALPTSAAGAAIRGGYRASQGRSAEFDALLEGAASVPGRMYRAWQKRKNRTREAEWKQQLRHRRRYMHVE